MALPTTVSPQNATIVFGTSGYSTGILTFTIDGVTRPAKDVTNLGTSGYRQFKPGRLKNPGTLSMSVQHDPTQEPPIGQDAETITITWNAADGSPSPTLTGSGFLTEYSIDASGGDEEEATADLTIQFDGNTGPTWAS